MDRGGDDPDRQRGEIDEGRHQREVKLGAVLLAWIVVALAAFGLHPALREASPLAGLGRQIAEDAAQGGVFLKAIWLPGANVSFAFWALVLALAYLVGWGIFLLCPRRPEAAPAEVSLPLLALAILGQIAAFFAKDATGFFFILCGAATLSIRRLQPQAGLRPAKAIPALGLGIALVLLASVLDAGLARLTGAPLLPEAWFPLAVEFSTRPLTGAALALVVAASCVALTRVRIPWFALAPACVLVLGPSNPAKGIAGALVIALLARSGAGPFWRAGFLLASTALMVVVVLAA